MSHVPRGRIGMAMLCIGQVAKVNTNRVTVPILNVFFIMRAYFFFF